MAKKYWKENQRAGKRRINESYELAKQRNLRDDENDEEEVVIEEWVTEEGPYVPDGYTPGSELNTDSAFDEDNEEEVVTEEWVTEEGPYVPDGYTPGSELNTDSAFDENNEAEVVIEERVTEEGPYVPEGYKASSTFYDRDTSNNATQSDATTFTRRSSRRRKLITPKTIETPEYKYNRGMMIKAQFPNSLRETTLEDQDPRYLKSEALNNISRRSNKTAQSSSKPAEQAMQYFDQEDRPMPIYLDNFVDQAIQNINTTASSKANRKDKLEAILQIATIALQQASSSLQYTQILMNTYGALRDLQLTNNNNPGLQLIINQFVQQVKQLADDNVNQIIRSYDNLQHIYQLFTNLPDLTPVIPVKVGFEPPFEPKARHKQKGDAFKQNQAFVHDDFAAEQRSSMDYNSDFGTRINDDDIAAGRHYTMLQRKSTPDLSTSSGFSSTSRLSNSSANYESSLHNDSLSDLRSSLEDSDIRPVRNTQKRDREEQENLFSVDNSDEVVEFIGLPKPGRGKGQTINSPFTISDDSSTVSKARSIASRSTAAHSIASRSTAAHSVASRSTAAHSVASRGTAAHSVASRGTDAHSVAAQDTQGDTTKYVRRSTRALAHRELLVPDFKKATTPYKSQLAPGNVDPESTGKRKKRKKE